MGGQRVIALRARQHGPLVIRAMTGAALRKSRGSKFEQVSMATDPRLSGGMHPMGSTGHCAGCRWMTGRTFYQHSDVALESCVPYVVIQVRAGKLGMRRAVARGALEPAMAA